MLNDRKKSTVKAFLSSIPKRLKKTVIAVCSDIYDGYINAAKKELAEEELEVLKLLFKYSSILEISYKLCNDLTDIFDSDISKSEAQLKINDWKNKVIKSGLACFNKFLSTLAKRMCEIVNYFISRQTSGFVEGLNNKIKVIKRRCYGIFNVEHLFQRIHLDMEGYSLFYLIYHGDRYHGNYQRAISEALPEKEMTTHSRMTRIARISNPERFTE